MAKQEIPVVKYNNAADQEGIEARWWTVDEKELHRHVFAIVSDIETRQIYRKVKNLRHARLYSNREVLGLQAGMFSRTVNDAFTDSGVTLNVIASCVDTAQAKIAKAKPRPMYLTIGGDWAAQERAKKRTRYMDGAFAEMKLYGHMQMAFRDSGIFGTGEVKFFKRDGKVVCERTLIDEVLIDDADAMYGNPSQKHQTKFMSKDVVCELFPKFAEKIMQAKSGLPPEIQSRFSLGMIKVIESWKLPSAKGAKDGLHSICIENCTLLAEQYKRLRFPKVTQRWKKPHVGYFGVGIAEELLGIQLAINKKLRSIEIAQDLMCVPRVWIREDSNINTGDLDNEIGGIGRYSTEPPQVSTWPGMPPEVYESVENLYHKAYEIIGISQLSANSLKPAGLNSSPALRTYQDVESERFQIVGQDYEEAHMEAAEIIEELTEELAAEGKDPSVTVKNGKEVETIKWSDVKMNDTPISVRCFPTSILPTQPAGKIQTVQELTQAGFIEKDMALSLLDFPDFEAAVSNMLASYNLIKKILCNMVEKGEYESPEPYMKLPQALTMAQNYYLQCRTENVPENRLELLRRFMDDVKNMIDEANAPDPNAPGPQGPGGAPGIGAGGPIAPQAVPMAPPQSELLPNAPGGA